MLYIKPQLQITKFDIVEDITGDFISAGPVNPDGSDNSGDLGYEDITNNGNAFNIGQ